MAAAAPRFRKIVVAIHGVGDQSHAETIRSVASQFGSRVHPPLPLMPLGYFSVDGGAKVKVSGLDLPPSRAQDADCAQLQELAAIGFAEVYWADIPRGAVKAGDTIEETKAWARTVVSRCEGVYRKRQQDADLLPHDFERVAGVIEEMVESVQVIENLCTVADKMGLFKFDVAPLLRDYVNDVQVVTEFPALREQIVGRFHKAMAGIVEEFGSDDGLPEIYIVAHSEGTVISFMALLQALAGTEVRDPEAAPDAQPTLVPTTWVDHVRGYMTIGSPIDKHLLLWERLWNPFRPRDGQSVFTRTPRQRIDWRNYYDLGDPVGFQLDTAYEFLRECGCKAFEFPASHDMGFARYPLPGKAHVDYWHDARVFGHFIDHVVLRLPSVLTGSRTGDRLDPARPPDRLWARLVCYALPYAVMLLLHFLAVYLLFKGVTAYSKHPISFWDVAEPVTVLAWLLAWVTVTARMLRLLKVRFDRGSHLLMLLGLLVGFALPSALLVLRVHTLPSAEIVAAAVIIITVAISLVPRRRGMDRIVLVSSGFLAAIGFAWWHVHRGGVDAALWPLVLGGAAFLYLWWLGILVFDLSFVWHRYIRHAVAQDKLIEWAPGVQARKAARRQARLGVLAEADFQQPA
ncbi:MFS transporter [Ramlibacter sp.]|uniref:MFS transporter n=1 Tax=Ramlibacter sp. TaxID=1917967 RepID=UPI0026327820|nr:MFS transporter [Ramlibacter sp.]MDB5958380.1 hypothetical protein [Ramlibacter sp.]